MSLDLYESESSERLSRLSLTDKPEPSAFDGFARGTGMAAMQTFAKAGRAASLAAGAVAADVDSVIGGTELQDRFFRWHDDVFGEAVAHWTPRPGEVGVAGQITGQLLATIPMVIASPAGTVAATGLGTAEDLVRKGVDTDKAIGTGVAQAAGLGLGIWVPILGQTLAQRVLLGGAGFNVAQGVGMRAAGELILEGTPAEGDFKAFDTSALTMDVLLGVAFGGIAHLSPSARAQGAKFWEQMDAWGKNLKPSDVDALLVTRQAQHINLDSLPGKPVDALSLDSHVQKVRQAIDQLANDKPVDVSDLPQGRFEVDEARAQDVAARTEQMQLIAETVRRVERLPDPRAEIESYLQQQRVMQGEMAVRRAVAEISSKTDAEGVPGFLRSAEQLVALRGDADGAELEPVVKRAIEIAKKPGFERTSEERIFLGSILEGKLGEYLQPRSPSESQLVGRAVTSALKDIKKARTEAPPAPRAVEPPPPRSGEGRPGGAEAEPPPPEVVEARRIADENPDLEITTGRDADGKPIKMKASDFIAGSEESIRMATEDAKLFEVAAACMLGGG